MSEPTVEEIKDCVVRVLEVELNMLNEQFVDLIVNHVTDAIDKKCLEMGDGSNTDNG